MFAAFWNQQKEAKRRRFNVAPPGSRVDAPRRSFEPSRAEDVALLQHIRDEAEAHDHISRPPRPPLSRPKGKERDSARKRKRDIQGDVENPFGVVFEADPTSSCEEGCGCDRHDAEGPVRPNYDPLDDIPEWKDPVNPIAVPSPVNYDFEEAHTCLPVQPEDVLTLDPCGCKRKCTEWLRDKERITRFRAEVADKTLPIQERHRRSVYPTFYTHMRFYCNRLHCNEQGQGDMGGHVASAPLQSQDDGEMLPQGGLCRSWCDQELAILQGP